ncbi:RNA polymerase sigma factor, partial [Dactylosporangium sucinum]
MSGYQHVFDAEHALAGGLWMLRDSMRDMFSTVIRGEGGSVPRTRGRPHTNEAPPRPGPAPNARPNAGMNGKPAGGGAGASLLGEETVPIPTNVTAGTTLVDTDPEPSPPPPARPDRGDPASEVWALIERAQAGDGAAFGLLYDRYFDTVFRFVYFRV